MPIHKIEGQVVNKATNETINDFTVTVTLQFNNQSLLSQEAVVESDTRFRITFEGNLWDNLPANAQVIARFEVKDATGKILPTDFVIPDLKRTDQQVIVPVEVAIPEPLRQVSGTVRLADGAPFGETGYTIRAFDAISGTNIVPLSTPANLSSNGEYRITYTWQSTVGRNGPSLLVRLFNPEGTIVTEATKMYASRQETMDLVIDQPISQTYTISGIVQNRVNYNPLPNVAITATFRANNRTILTQGSRSNTSGEFTIPFERSHFENQLLPIEVTFQLTRDNQSLQTATTIPDLLPRDQTITILATVSEPDDSRFTVRGTIMHADGQQANGITIRGFDIDLRSQELLAETQTDLSGHYYSMIPGKKKYVVYH
jgi:hypothetical protein